MDRRKFLKAAAGTAAAGSVGLAAPAIAQGKRELKMVTSWPKNLPALGVGANRFAQKISDLTDGNLTVRVYAGGELVPPFEVFDAVSRGTADLYHSSSFLFQGKTPALNFFTTVPFGLTSAEMMGWMYFGGGQQLFDELLASYKLKGHIVGTAGVQMFGWTNKEIRSLDDLKGLKYRMPGLGAEVMRRLGVAVVNIPPAEIMASFQSGAIDGTEWASPFVDIGLAFYKAAKFYYYPGFHEPGTTVDAAWNLDVWNSLTKQQKTAVEVAAMSETATMRGEFAGKNGEALKTLVEKHGVQVKPLPEDVLTALAKTSAEVLAEMAKADAMTQKVYESYRGFAEHAVRWSNVSELPFMQARQPLFS